MEGTWKKGNVQNIQEVRSGNPVAFIYVPDLYSGLLLGFRKETHGAFDSSPVAKQLNCPFIYPQQKQICFSLKGEHPSRVLLLLIFMLCREAAASASSLANQATNRCSNPSLNHLTIHCHRVSDFKGHQIQHHL